MRDDDAWEIKEATAVACHESLGSLHECIIGYLLINPLLFLSLSKLPLFLLLPPSTPPPTSSIYPKPDKSAIIVPRAHTPQVPVVNETCTEPSFPSQPWLPKRHPPHPRPPPPPMRRTSKPCTAASAPESQRVCTACRARRAPCGHSATSTSRASRSATPRWKRCTSTSRDTVGRRKASNWKWSRFDSPSWKLGSRLHEFEKATLPVCLPTPPTPTKTPFPSAVTLFVREHANAEGG